MRLPTVALPIVLSLTAAQLPAAAQSRPAFDVTSVKRVQSDTGRRAGGASILPGGRLSAPNATLRGLIATAYGLLDLQIVDARRMLDTDFFEIEGRTNPDLSAADARAMLRTLLAERFGLVAHSETRDLPVYEMTLARDDRRPGPQLRPSGPDCALPKGPAGVPPPPPPPSSGTLGRPLPLSITSSRCALILFNSTLGAHWSLREITLAGLAERLTDPLGRPVLDRTGLEGAFDIDLTYSPDNPSIDTSGAPNAPALMAAVREQLGLRLESSRAPVEVLVIDQIRPPTEN